MIYFDPEKLAEGYLSYQPIRGNAYRKVPAQLKNWLSNRCCRIGISNFCVRSESDGEKNRSQERNTAQCVEDIQRRVRETIHPSEPRGEGENAGGTTGSTGNQPMKKKETFQFVHTHVLPHEADEVHMVLRHRGGTRLEITDSRDGHSNL